MDALITNFHLPESTLIMLVSALAGREHVLEAYRQAVAEKYRRNGVAEALMKEMEERGRQKDVTIFFLEVRESNDAARRLYEKMGYEQIGVRKNFYEKPAENAIIMSKGWRTA